jgi:hypothetical protein
MAVDMQEQNNSSQDTKSGMKNKALVALAVVGVMLALTWAIATFFEIAIAKALAAVIIFLFCVIVALLMTGIA